MNKKLHLSIIAFLIFSVVGITNAQNVKNIIVDIKINSPSEGELIPHRIPVEGIVEFSQNIDFASYILFVSVQTPDQIHYISGWNGEVKYVKLNTTFVDGKYIAKWKIGDQKASVFVGPEFEDMGKEFAIQAFVIRASDLQLFKDKYYIFGRNSEYCKIYTNDFNNIISDFQGSFISNPINVKREYVNL